jgi:hypothetical protein
MTGEQFERFLKAALTRQTQTPPGGDEAAVERVLKRLSGPLPRQKQPLWRLPSVLLNWEVRAGLATHGSSRLLRSARFCCWDRRARSSVRPTRRDI